MIALPMLCAVLLGADVPSPESLTQRVGGLRGFPIGPVTGEYPRNGEGSTIRLKDGTLLHAFSRHRAGEDRNPDMWPGLISFTRSLDDGKTWSPLEIVFRNPDGRTAMQPSFLRLPNGELGVTYSLIYSFSSAKKVFRYSADEGSNWSPEQVISPPGGYWTGAHDRFVRHSSGRILYPLHTKVSVTPERLATRVAYSDDSGRTWLLSRDTLTVDDVIADSDASRRDRRSFHEASIAERADGSLFMIGRSMAGRLYRSVSTDRGATWTKPEPTSLFSGAAPGRLERLPGSGDLLVIWSSCCLNKDDFVLGQRLTLSSAISSDSGITWRTRRVLADITPGTAEEPHWVDYPSISFDRGKAYFAYRLVVGRGTPTVMQQYMAVLPIAWFTAARDENPTAAPDTARFLSAEELRQAFAKLPIAPPTNREIQTTDHVGLKVARVENRDGPREVQRFEDRIFVVTEGSATLRVEDGRDLPMAAGAAIIVPRGVPYQIRATSSKVEFLVIRVQ
jgi:mannose-6-phosphate isomerase-like protein (cupin superfamily)